MAIFPKDEEIPPLCFECNEFMERQEAFTDIFAYSCPKCDKKHQEFLRKMKPAIEKYRKNHPQRKMMEIRKGKIAYHIDLRIFPVDL